MSDVDLAPDEVPVHQALGMTDEEFASVQSILGRHPEDAELATTCTSSAPTT